MMKRNLFHSKHKWLKPCAILTCTAVLFWWVMAFPFADVPLYAATDETAITGDMNHDKIVNSTDLTLLKYAILKNDNTMLKYGDMTGDGVLNKDDATVLQEFLLGFYDFTSMLITVGNYDAENQQLAVSWFTGSKILKYTVWTSNDNCTFTKIADVADKSSYTLKFDDQEKKQYFKVSFVDENGNRIESNVIYTVPTELGLACQSVDTDADGLDDMLEKIMRTNPYKADTDDDGLTDYEEYALTNSNPNQPHSIKSGVLDADADADADGLTNQKEIALGTDCNSADTDNDGISDGAEVRKYNTSPLLTDTDGDTLDDSFEIRYALNPLSATTNEINDAEHILFQSISDDNALWTTIFSDDNAYRMSMDIEIAGDAEKMLGVQESRYSAAFENDAQVGKMVDISLSSDTAPSSIELSFTLDASIVTDAQSNGTHLNDFESIRRFSVFKYFEDLNMLLPVNTEYDTKNNVLKAKVSSLGTFCVMNMEKWYASFGIEVSDVAAQFEKEMTQGRPQIAGTAIQSNNVNFEKPIYIICIIPNRGESESVYNQQIQSIADFAQMALQKYPSSHFNICAGNYSEVQIEGGYNTVYSVTGWQEITMNSNKQVEINSKPYFQLHQKSDYYPIKFLYDDIDLSVRFNTQMREELEDENTAVFVFDFQNGREDDYAVSYWSTHDYCYSWIHSDDYNFEMTKTENGTVQQYKQLMQLYTWLTGGDEITDMDTAVQQMMNVVDTNIRLQQMNVSSILSYGSNLKIGSLKSLPTPNSTLDSDGDSISDWDEALTKFMKVHTDGSYDLPSMRTMLKTLNVSALNDVALVTKPKNVVSNSSILAKNLLLKKVLPWASDPTKLDTDEDGIEDDMDAMPVDHADARFSLCEESNYSTLPENAWVTERLRASEDDYRSCNDDGSIISNLDYKYSYRVRFTALLAVVGLADARNGIANFGISELCSKLVCAFFSDGSQIGGLYHAPAAMEHFFVGLGTPYYFSDKDICELISSSPNNLEHLFYNLTKAMKYSEQITVDDSEIFFTTVPNANLKATCFDNKGHNCVFTGNEINKIEDTYWTNRHKNGIYMNSTHVDWHITVGESFGGIRAKIKRTGDTYTMTYRYCINDIYEWTPTQISRVNNLELEYVKDDLGYILHTLHRHGYAKEFAMSGSFEGTLTWKAGALIDDVAQQIKNDLKNIEGFRRWTNSNVFDKFYSNTHMDYNQIP